EFAARAGALGAEIAAGDAHLVEGAALAIAPDRGLARAGPAPGARRRQPARGLGSGRVGRQPEDSFDGQRQDSASYPVRARSQARAGAASIPNSSSPGRTTSSS